MTDTTVETPAEATRIQIDPVAMANEARAMNDFLTSHSLQNANNVVMLFRKVKELEAEIEEHKARADDLTRITVERDLLLQQRASDLKTLETIQTEKNAFHQSLNEALAEIEALKAARTRRKVKSND